MIDIFKYINYLSCPKIRGVLQIGASSGQEIEFFKENNVDYGIFVEPIDEPYFQLLKKIENNKNYIPIKALCTDMPRSNVEYYLASNNGESSSILKPSRHLLDYPHVKFPNVVALESVTIDQIYNHVCQTRSDVAEQIDLLYIDIQGAELEALKGSTAVLNKVHYIYTEVGLGGGYTNDVAASTLINFLKLYYFDVYHLEINPTGWGNALFVKREFSTASYS